MAACIGITVWGVSDKGKCFVFEWGEVGVRDDED